MQVTVGEECEREQEDQCRIFRERITEFGFPKIDRKAGGRKILAWYGPGSTGEAMCLRGE
ncbi:hypothetical protein BU197_07745 [Streptomyces sp. CBMA291]|nr:hypothetical protein [Streptomyces sp. CBMA291]MBD0712652.1 hypothetical protein [Streptomyces sp. CBMA370]